MLALADWLTSATARLTAAGIESARLEAQVLLAHALGVSRTWLLAHPSDTFDPASADRYLARRLNREPLAYIVGEREFYGRSFIVNPAVLIPRQDTETLITAALAATFPSEHANAETEADEPSDQKIGMRGATEAWQTPTDRNANGVQASSERVARPAGYPGILPKRNPNPNGVEERTATNDDAHPLRCLAPPATLAPLERETASTNQPKFRVLDVGTGSGCLAVTLALERPDWSVSASDISPDALAVARQNAERLGAEVRLVESDLFAAFAGERFDLIVSNPPYIADSESLMPEVSLHEPGVALFSGPTGFEIYERLVGHAPDYLAHGGWLMVEVGHTQAPTVSGLLLASGFSDVGTILDLSGVSRVVQGRKDGRWPPVKAAVAGGGV